MRLVAKLSLVALVSVVLVWEPTASGALEGEASYFVTASTLGSKGDSDEFVFDLGPEWIIDAEITYQVVNGSPSSAKVLQVEWRLANDSRLDYDSLLARSYPKTHTMFDVGRRDPGWTPDRLRWTAMSYLSPQEGMQVDIEFRARQRTQVHNAAGGTAASGRVLRRCDLMAGNVLKNTDPDGHWYRVTVPAGGTVWFDAYAISRSYSSGYLTLSAYENGAWLTTVLGFAPRDTGNVAQGSWVNTGVEDRTIDFRVFNSNLGHSGEIWDYVIESSVGELAQCDQVRSSDGVMGWWRPGGYGGDPTEVSSGNFVDSRLDLEFPVQIAGMELSRTYNSLDDQGGVFGQGWTSTLDVRLQRFYNEEVTLVDSTGHRWEFVDDGAGGLDPPAGLRADLVEGGDGSWTLTFDDEMAWSFNEAGILVEQSTWDGQIVTTAVDGQGRPTGWSSSTGYGVTIAYGPEGRPATATATDGRTVAYGYDSEGRLVSVTDPSGVAETYGLDGLGRIIEIRNDAGDVQVANTYDAYGRVQAQDLGAGRTIGYAYDAAAAVTTVSHGGSGDVTAYGYDALQRLVTITDDAGSTASRTWTADDLLASLEDRTGAVVSQSHDSSGNLTSRTDAAGNVWSYTYDGSDRVTSMTDPAGYATSYGYDGDERLPSTVTDPTGAVTTFSVDDGLVTQATDADGVVTSYGYDAARNLVSITDGQGNTTAFGHDAAGRRTSATTPMGHTTAWTYDGAGRVLSVTDPSGATASLTYDQNGDLASMIDPGGGVTDYAHDAHGRLSSIADPLDRTTSYSYDSDGQLATITKPGGATTTFAYSPMGRLASETDPEGVTTSYGYDANGNRTTVTDGAGHTRSYQFDSLGRLTSTTAADGGTTSYTYDPRDLLTSTTDPVGNVSSFAYDAAGRLASTTAPDGGVTTTSYTAAGRPAVSTNPMGETVTRSYDATGRLTAITDPAGGVSAFAYNADSELVSSVEPSGLTTGFTYDENGRTATITAPDGGVTAISYQATGQTAIIDGPAAGPIEYGYDLAGELVSVVNPMGHQTTYGRDGRGNLTSRTDARGAAQTWTYDLADRPVAVTDALGESTTITYDAAGRTDIVTDPSGRTLDHGYDPVGRLDAVVASDGSVTSTETRSHDAAGRLRTLTVDGATTALDYDPVGGLTVRTDPDGDTHHYSYDLAGRTVAHTDPTGTTTSTTYDARGLVASIADPDAGTAQFSYDADGRPTGEDLPGTSDDRSYSYTNGRLTGFTQGPAGYTLNHDPAGRVTSETGAHSRTFTYDNAGQLTSATHDGDSWTFAYDAAGNLVSEDAPGSDADWTATFDAANRLTSRISGPTTEAFTYDDAGRLTAWNATTAVHAMTYDPWGRPATTTSDDGTTLVAETTSYQPTGQPDTITIDDGQPTTWELEWDDRPIPQLTSWDNGTTTRFTSGPLNRLWATTSTGSAPFHYTPDRNPAPTPATSPLLAATSYDPWGTPDSHAPSEPTIGFRGELNLGPRLHLRARTYQPNLRRFTTRDPLDGVAGTTTESNPYHYANNDPTNLSDPLGLRPITDADLDNVISLAGCTFVAPDSLIINRTELTPFAKGHCPRQFANTNIDGLIRLSLEAIGMIPIIGEAADLTLCGWDLQDHQWVDAGFDCAAIIPFLGTAPRAARWGDRAIDAVDTTHDLQRAPRTTPRGPDFVAGPVGSGPPVPVSQSRMAAGFDAAGFPRIPTTSAGMEYTLPDGSLVRLMQPSGNAPLRASFTNANGGPINPFTGKPVQPPAPSGWSIKDWVRALTHVEQTP